LLLFPKAAAAFTPAARIPRQLSGTLQLRGNLKVRLSIKPLFDWMILLLHKIFWDACGISAAKILSVPLALAAPQTLPAYL
jgi:hypothetical protein